MVYVIFHKMNAYYPKYIVNIECFSLNEMKCDKFHLNKYMQHFETYNWG